MPVLVDFSLLLSQQLLSEAGLLSRLVLPVKAVLHLTVILPITGWTREDWRILWLRGITDLLLFRRLMRG
jgi:hypothetical protein